MATAARPTQSIQSSALSRNPQAVFAAADAGPVEITRRDGESFLLCTLSQSQIQNHGIGIAADVLAVLLTKVTIEEDSLEQVFPWLRFFTAADRAEFRTEFVAATRACVAVGLYDHLLLTVNAWASKAQSLAEGLRAGPVDVAWPSRSIEAAAPRHDHA